ncbi:MAG: hypothetical protein EOM67_16930, partial [Spirochaetia bacterium]|nr:hypothetical protein [Spirochaetia bacterium]
MSILCFSSLKKAYDKGNYPLDPENSGWISPAGDIYFISDPDQEHSQLLLEIHDVGEYTPSEAAMKEYTKDRTEADYLNEEGKIELDYFVAMAFFDGWIRFFGGEDGRWAGVEGNIVNLECYDLETLKKLHSFVKQEKVRFRSSEIWVEVEKIKYLFTGTTEQFIETGLDIRAHKVIATRKKKADVGDYWYIQNKLYDASEAGHAKIIQTYLERDPDVDPEELENMYNSDYRFREYDLNTLDGIRIAQDQVEVGELTPSKLNKIRKAFVELYGEEAFEMKIGLQVNNTKTYYFNIPLEEINGDLMQNLRRYKSYGAKQMKYLSTLLKADFSGDF